MAGEHLARLLLQVLRHLLQRRQPPSSRGQGHDRRSVGGFGAALIHQVHLELDQVAATLLAFARHLSVQELGVADVVELSDRVLELLDYGVVAGQSETWW